MLWPRSDFETIGKNLSDIGNDPTMKNASDNPAWATFLDQLRPVGKGFSNLSSKWFQHSRTYGYEALDSLLLMQVCIDFNLLGGLLQMPSQFG